MPKVGLRSRSNGPRTSSRNRCSWNLHTISFWTFLGALCLQLSVHDKIYAPFHRKTAVSSYVRRPEGPNSRTTTTPPRPRKARSSPEIQPRQTSLQIEQPTNTTIGLPQTRRKIAFIHVGKAGGNTVRAALPRFRCRRLQQGRRAEQRCLQREANLSGSSLARDADTEIHLRIGPHTRDSLQGYTTFLVALRNPITRVISAYHFLHPAENLRSPYAQRQHPLKDLFYQECFPTMDRLWTTVDDILSRAATPSARNDTVGYSDCQRVALRALKGRHDSVRHINVHLHDNYQYYYERTLGLFDDRSDGEDDDDAAGDDDDNDDDENDENDENDDDHNDDHDNDDDNDDDNDEGNDKSNNNTREDDSSNDIRDTGNDDSNEDDDNDNNSEEAEFEDDDDDDDATSGFKTDESIRRSSQDTGRNEGRRISTSAYYLDKSVPTANHQKEVFVVRTEHLWDDIKDLDIALGGSGVFTKEGAVLNENKQLISTQLHRGLSRKANRNKTLRQRRRATTNDERDVKTRNVETTEAQVKGLCCILWEELKSYQSFLERASNLNRGTKMETLQEVWKTCSITPENASHFTFDNTDDAVTVGFDLNFSWEAWYRQSCPDLTLGRYFNL